MREHGGRVDTRERRLGGVGRVGHAIGGVATALLTLGCAAETLPTEALAPGAPAQVVLQLDAVAGGHAYREETRIDSASQRFTVRACDAAPIGLSCATLRTVREGTVLPNLLQELFSATTRPQFRRLADWYASPPGVVRPDGGAVTLEVVRNGRRRIIRWATDAYLPSTLVEFQCLLRAARGDLLLCD